MAKNIESKIPSKKSIRDVVSRIDRGSLIYIAQVNTDLSQNPRTLAKTPTEKIVDKYVEFVRNLFESDNYERAQSHLFYLKQLSIPQRRKYVNYSSN